MSKFLCTFRITATEYSEPGRHPAEMRIRVVTERAAPFAANEQAANFITVYPVSGGLEFLIRGAGVASQLMDMTAGKNLLAMFQVENGDGWEYEYGEKPAVNPIEP